MGTKLLIIGGVAGGASAAARARRVDETAKIILIERGEYVSFANCGLPYYIGNEIKNRDDLLVTTPDMLRNRFRIDVRTLSEATAIDTAKKTVEIRNVITGETVTESYDKLILSPGAAPIRPPLPGIDLDTIFVLRSLSDTDRIKKYVDERAPKNAVVVGGGFIGLEMAENLVLRGVKVTIVEMLDQVMAPMDFEMAAMVQQHLRDKGVVLRLRDGVKSFRREGDDTVVTLSSGDEVAAAMVILAIGVRPETALAKQSGLELGATGGIHVDAGMRTSNADVYAVGDAVEVEDFVSGRPVLIPLAGPANKQGRIAADNALGRNRTYKKTQGTAIVKVFDLAVAATGNSEKALKRADVKCAVSFTHSGSRAGYYPGAQPMSVKLIFCPESGRLLGAQIVGGEGVDKRIDVLATAIRAGMSVTDLEDLELAYAPPYSSAKDPVNMAGFVAGNIMSGDHVTIQWNEIDSLDPATHTLLDVREKMERERLGVIGDAVHIPLNQLRDRLGELDKSKTIVVYCAAGLRGYVAQRILAQNGFKSLNLSGGYKTYSAAKKELGV